MNHGYAIEYSDIRLDPLVSPDIEKLRDLRNANAHYFSDSKRITLEQQKQWFSRYLEKPGDFMFSIRRISSMSEDPIGFVALYNYDNTKSHIEFGRFLIDDLNRGMGLGEQALMAALTIAFTQMLVSRVSLVVLVNNARARALYEKIGFTVTEVVEDQGSLVNTMTITKEKV